VSKTIEISDETYDRIKDQLSDNDFTVDSLNDFIGKCFFFRTVSYHLVGRVIKRINDNIFQLEGASWIADSGRFMQAIKEGVLLEVEPVGDAFVNLDSVTDFFPWKHSLPTRQK